MQGIWSLDFRVVQTLWELDTTSGLQRTDCVHYFWTCCSDTNFPTKFITTGIRIYTSENLRVTKKKKETSLPEVCLTIKHSLSRN